MRFQLVSAIALVALVSSVNCGCDRSGDVKPSDDGDVTQFFKNLGCDIKKRAEQVSDSAKPYIDDIKKGAEKVSESAKPYIDDIGSTAKKFSGSVADRFNNLKEKISGSSDNATESSASSSSPAETKAFDGSSTPTPLSTTSDLPELGNRVLLDGAVEPRCPENTMNDGRGHCRSIG